MSPKEKAIELVDKYLRLYIDNPRFRNEYMQLAKESALICVEEILQTNPTIKGRSSDLVIMIVQTKAYWYQVQNTITKL